MTDFSHLTNLAQPALTDAQTVLETELDDPLSRAVSLAQRQDRMIDNAFGGSSMRRLIETMEREERLVEPFRSATTGITLNDGRRQSASEAMRAAEEALAKLAEDSLDPMGRVYRDLERCGSLQEGKSAAMLLLEQMDSHDHEIELTQVIEPAPVSTSEISAYVPPALATEEGQERRAEEFQSRIADIEGSVSELKGTLSREAHRARLSGYREGRKKERVAWLRGLSLAVVGAVLCAIASALLG